MELSTGLVLALPIALGVVLLILAKWASSKNRQLAEKDDPYLYKDFLTELRNGRVREATRKYFFGSVHGPAASAGRWLAIAVILIVTLALVFVLAVIVKGSS